MDTEGEGGSGVETPFAVARRLHQQGVSAEEVERQLRALGLDAADAALAARAGRGEAGAASSVVRVAADVEPEQPAAPPSEAPTHPCPAHPAWPVAATCSRCGKFFCAQCLHDGGLTRIPRSKQCPTCEATHPEVMKVGGWLVLPSLHVTVVGPLSALVTVVQDVSALRTADASLWPPVLVELAFAGFLGAYSVYTALQFHRRKRSTVNLMFGFYGLLIGMRVLEMMLQAWINALLTTPLPEEKTMNPAGGAVMLFIWIAYFSQSKRVKDTFVVD